MGIATFLSIPIEGRRLERLRCVQLLSLKVEIGLILTIESPKVSLPTKCIVSCLISFDKGLKIRLVLMVIRVTISCQKLFSLYFFEISYQVLKVGARLNDLWSHSRRLAQRSLGS